ncbi:NAD(P)-binding protein [Polyplosphaeria fusca]|uniref:NAD(P)-binding protein n=1 Tax=Polyplosphaeria fusca TaxID=682080 RepID=A0A9P4V4C0_9PLEO|nr:NAD(P)-binding protein [Polyplosphaeria fusca]
MNTVVYLGTQFFELLSTAFLILIGLSIPGLRHLYFKFTNMSKTFVPAQDIPSLEGKVILVTGGNIGLGKQTIAYLAAHNPQKIYLAARTASKATTAIADIKKTVPSAPVVHLPLDLTSFASIKAAASTFTSQETRLDLLINNAGVMAIPNTPTAEGYEVQFGTNHMGHALLTKLLLPTLLRTAEDPANDVRIVNVSSIGHNMAPSGGIIFDQTALGNSNTWRRYSVSKLANILHARSLAEHYPSITAVSLHPGVILTDLYTSVSSNPFMKLPFMLYKWVAGWLPGHFAGVEGGALTQTWAATAPKDQVTNGAYYMPVGNLSSGSGYARDAGLAKKLWEWTEGELEKHGA